MLPSDLPCFPSSHPNFAGITGNQLTQEHVYQLVHLLNQAKITQPDANPVNQNAMAAYAGNSSMKFLMCFILLSLFHNSSMLLCLIPLI